MAEIHERLYWLRSCLGLSLRDVRRRLAEVDYSVSHDSVRSYEKGATVPAEYVAALEEAFGVTAEWLLHGVLPPAGVTSPLMQALEEIDAAGPVQGAASRRRREWQSLLTAWETFVEGAPPSHPLRQVVVRSWFRSRERGLDPRPERVEYRRIPELDLRRRLEKERPLLEAATPHMAWASSLLGDLRHVLSLVGADGVILRTVTNEPRLLEGWNLLPGVDWAEEVMGMNGAGTALREGRPVAVVGAEHLLQPFHDSVCLGAPVRGPDGTVAGALDLSTKLEDGRPERLAMVAYIASMVERDLCRGASGA